jgi:hypothetical protein
VELFDNLVMLLLTQRVEEDWNNTENAGEKWE